MPYTLKQLEARRDACIKKIQELKDSADDIGGTKLGKLEFNSSAFFTGLVAMRKEDIDLFLSLFPQLPRVLDIALQAAGEEMKRRKFEEEIEKFRKEKENKLKRFYEAEKKKDRKRSKRLQRLAAAPALEEGTSQEMDQTSLFLELFVFPLTI